MSFARLAPLLGIALFGTFGLATPAITAESDLAKLTLRARVIGIEPDLPVRIHWRYGGEGQGGSVIRGEFTRLKRMAPAAPKELGGLQAAKKKNLLGDDDPLQDLLGEKEADTGQIEIEGKGFNFVYVKKGTWSPAIPVTNFNLRKLITVTLQPYAKGNAESEDEPAEETDSRAMRNVQMEFDLLLGDKVLKRFREDGPNGPTVGISLPVSMVRAGMSPQDKEFLDAVCGLARYAELRAEFLESLPWANRPLPKRYAIITDCYGYKPGAGYGVRTTNLDVMANEYRALQQLGVNGLRGAPAEIIQMAGRGEGFAKNFQRALISRSMGYPVPGADRDEDTGELESVPENAGCPYHPDVWKRAQPMIDETVERMTSLTGFDEIWGLTADEIGCIFDRSGEGKNHRYVCPHCIRGYRQMLKEEGRTPADFGKQSWEEVDPWTGTGPKPLTWQVAMKQKKDAAYQKALGFKVRVPGDDPEAGAGLDLLDDIAKDAAEAKVTTNKKEVSNESIVGKELLDYYNSRFLNYASARSFTPLKNALDEANAKKQAALDAGQIDSSAAKQPWVYSYALRGQTFIRSHSLDFFEFYRHADNGFVYETSHTNRFTQIFDSYICDVGREVSQQMNKRYGIYVKPHRGSGMQRAMSFASRGGTMLYWYTYGPEYAKGDSFASKPWLLEEMSRCARLLGAAEDRIYGAKPAYPAEVGIVKPRTTTLLGGEIDNALWTYVALAHAHVPVDPLDEHMLEHDDLSQYKVIYVSGKYLRKASAERLAAWVKAGGTLYTSGGGMLLDEAQEPLKVLWPVFGVKERFEIETTEKGEAPNDRWKVVKSNTFAHGLHPRSREEIRILPQEIELLSMCVDGEAGAIRHKYGQGEAYLVAFPAGSEYGASVTHNTPEVPADMEANADPVLRSYVTLAALEKVKPPVNVNKANVEAVYLKNPDTKKRAVTLINWAYKLSESGRLEHNRFHDVNVVIATDGPVQKVRSAWLDKELPFQQEGDRITVTVPELWEADVLLID